MYPCKYSADEGLGLLRYDVVWCGVVNIYRSLVRSFSLHILYRFLNLLKLYGIWKQRAYCAPGKVIPLYNLIRRHSYGTVFMNKFVKISHNKYRLFLFSR